MVRFTLTVTDFTENGAFDVAKLDNLSLLRAMQLAEDHARRGFNLFGGAITRMNWGRRGGIFPKQYRNATITLDKLT